MRASLFYRLAWAQLVRGTYTEVLETVQTAMKLLGPSDQFLRASLASVAAGAYDVLLQYDQAEASANLALSLTDQIAGVPLQLLAETRGRAYY